MIPDEEVVQYFQKIVNTPVSFMDGDLPNRGRQIFRGIPLVQRKDAHPNGCARHMTVFNKFGVIPKNCFDCYKVLITPRTVMEFFKLLMIFENITLLIDNQRKCMVETRDDCSGTYKGYIYCRGVEEGNDIRKIIRKIVSDDISPQVAVTLKRGCSEFAHAYPGYARIKMGSGIMQYRKEWQIHEDFVDKNVVFYPNVPLGNSDDKTTYTPWEIYSMQYWLRYAAMIHDTSYLAISGMTLQPLPNTKRLPLMATTPLKRNK